MPEIKSSFGRRARTSGSSSKSTSLAANRSTSTPSNDDYENIESSNIIVNKSKKQEPFTDDSNSCSSSQNIDLKSEPITEELKYRIPQSIENSSESLIMENNNFNSNPISRSSYDTDGPFNATEGVHSNLSWPEIENSQLIPNLKVDTIAKSVIGTMRPLNNNLLTVSNSEGILMNLINEENQLLRQLKELKELYPQVLKKGNGSTAVRNNVMKVFKNLFLINQAIAELYEKDSNKKNEILKSFQSWQENKMLINAKLDEIKSEYTEEGNRLIQLTLESSKVDSEIKTLEKRLSQLKEKKRTLTNEISKSQSTIESRSSLYYEDLNEIRNFEKNAILRLSGDRLFLGEISKSLAPSSTETSIIGLNSLLSKFSFNTLQSSQGLNLEKLETSRVIEVLERQIDFLNDKTSYHRARESKYYDCTVIWESISELLNNLEGSLANLLNSPTDPDDIELKIKSQLQETLTQLAEKEISLYLINWQDLKDLIELEINILKQGIRILEFNSTSAISASKRELETTLKAQDSSLPPQNTL
ncbi:hypothetical protein WICMUC_003841 [Wickerhamomyces mucosus]|uniref:Autophagy-related protein 28 n=1 Tax=Wickerhamomyces mucosus TaxID=1378264 RepID=A0A9P8PJA9_9ASCO|nr:hypothetical protein WICMUC_003841 [Wickerhamomyces mucosus]